MKLKFAILAIVMAWFCRDGARAQSTCVAQLNQVTATGVSATIDNRFTMCASWVVTYNLTGFSGISLRLETANDVSGAPGTFALSTGTVVVGTNPSTATNCQTSNACQFIISEGYAPWVRLNLTSATGTGSLTALAFGFQAAVPIVASISGGTLCTSGTPCVVDGTDAVGSPSTHNPVQVAGNDGANVRAIATDSTGNTKVVGPGATGSPPVGNPVEIAGTDGTNTRGIATDTSGRTVEVGAAAIGASAVGNPIPTASVDSADKLIAPQVCTLSFTFDTSAAGNTLLVAASGSTQVRLCKFSAIDVATGNTFQLKQGTGATCAGGTTNLGQVYTNVLTVAQDYNSPLIAAAANAVCLNLTNATRVVGEGQFAQY